MGSQWPRATAVPPAPSLAVEALKPLSPPHGPVFPVRQVTMSAGSAPLQVEVKQSEKEDQA